MKVTFGKFNGWDTNDIAKAGEPGRNYLRWGAENLKSKKWRDEFDRALQENTYTGTDVALHAKAMMVQDGFLDWNDALALAQEMAYTDAELQKEADEHEAKREEFLAKWAEKFGVTRDVFVPAAKRILNAHSFGELSRSQFSSDEKYNLAQEMVSDADAWLIDLYDLSY